MQVCTDYKMDFKYINDVDEINITLIDQTIDDLVTFCNNHEKQRVNVCIENNDMNIIIVHLLEELNKSHSELAERLYFRLPSYRESKFLYNLFTKENNIFHFYSNEYIDDWATLDFYKNLGVSDMFIVNDLGFELFNVKRVLHKENIKIRVFPDIAQSKWKIENPLYSFFIRPEDISEYEGYVDVIEFHGRPESIESLFRVYVLRESWPGSLNNLIINFENDMIGKYVFPELFVRVRRSCGKKCIKGGSCKICKQIYDLSKSLEDKNIQFTKL